MAAIRPVEPVVRVCAAFAASDSRLDDAIARLRDRWGEIAIATPPTPFDSGGYYERSMGGDLVKRWVAFGEVVSPDGLADWKWATNRMEQEWAAGTADAGGSRVVNLDPGYVTQAKLVLATTKDRDHRIYLRDGIFAEVTLSYTGGRWVDHRWTYPDYRTDTVRAFVDACRSLLRRHLQRRGGRRL